MTEKQEENFDNVFMALSDWSLLFGLTVPRKELLKFFHSHFWNNSIYFSAHFVDKMITYEMKKKSNRWHYFIFLLSVTRREKNYLERIKEQQTLYKRRHPTQEHLSCYERRKANQKLERIKMEELLRRCCLLIRLLFRRIELIVTR